MFEKHLGGILFLRIPRSHLPFIERYSCGCRKLSMLIEIWLIVYVKVCYLAGFCLKNQSNRIGPFKAMRIQEETYLNINSQDYPVGLLFLFFIWRSYFVIQMQQRYRVCIFKSRRSNKSMAELSTIGVRRTASFKSEK